MQLTSPFNPALLEAVSDFGPVTIINAGQERLPPRRLAGGLRTKWQWGEQYRFPCPFCLCEDSMVVSYQWGVEEYVTSKNGTFNLVRCFEFACHETSLNMGFFVQLLRDRGYYGLHSLRPSRSER